MSLSGQVQERLQSFLPGEIISYRDFSDFKSAQVVAKALSRLAKQGSIKRLSKGKYYIPKETKYGTLGPSESQLIESLLKDDPGSYISGVAAYNQLGLTTQVPAEITIVGSRFDRAKQVGKLKIRFERSSFPLSTENAALFPLMDAIQDIKKIPDSNIDESLKVLKTKLTALSRKGIQDLIALGLNYRPFGRALLGSLVESCRADCKNDLKALKNSLNPISTFKFGSKTTLLPTQEVWQFR